MIPSKALSFLLVLVGVALPACSVMASGDDFVPPITGPGLGEFAPSGINTEPSCDSGQEVYLLGVDGTIRALEPTTRAVRELPALKCPTGATANSMAIDSRGEAWVGFVDGSLFRAELSTGECRATAFDGPKRGWSRFGMGFVAARGGGDVLYVYDNGTSETRQLATIDLATEKLQPLGALATGGVGLELTGRGDGTLFGLVSGAPTFIARVDVDRLELVNRVDLPIAETAGWAVAHWGGRFYVFTAVAVGHSRLDVLTPGKGAKRVIDDLGFEAVGAGVSPCAPTELR